MARALYFDCFSGISGDMTFGALLDLGLEAEQVFTELAKLGISGYEVRAKKTTRYAITGTDLTVIIKEQQDKSDGQGGNHGRHHEHAHKHHHGHDHNSHHERNLADIRDIIQESRISSKAKEMAIDIFTEIATAEGRVHGKPTDEVHFHEVGALDSIVDIVGVAICMDMLGIEKFFCSPLQEGRGFVQCQHGKLPVPVPAVIEMLSKSGLILQTGDVEGELITPTGAGIVKVLAGGSAQMPPMRIERTGYGFGKRDTGSLNALRVILGETNSCDHDTGRPYDTDSICEIRTNLDDMTGEELGFLSEKLFENGALDVFYTAVQMKKNRPGVLLTVLAEPKTQSGMTDIVLRHSSAIGVRISYAERQKLFRQTVYVETPYGRAAVKKAYAKHGNIVRYAPEYEDCRRIARENDLTLKSVLELARQAAESVEE